MPLQNRVTPWSAIVAHAARYPEPTATFGNRGVLHGDHRNIVRPFNGKMWLSCKLRVDRSRKRQLDDNRAFNGRKRVLMTPRRYTELFFLDEVTAMAAGHRPCACCRRADYARFIECWARTFPRPERWTAAAVDAELHQARLDSALRKAVYSAPLASLPDGVFIAFEGHEPALPSEREDYEEDAWLLWAGHLHRWTHHGYTERRPAGDSANQDAATPLHVRVLTPRPLVSLLHAGYEPGPPHESALVQ